MRRHALAAAHDEADAEVPERPAHERLALACTAELGEGGGEGVVVHRFRGGLELVHQKMGIGGLRIRYMQLAVLQSGLR